MAFWKHETVRDCKIFSQMVTQSIQQADPQPHGNGNVAGMRVHMERQCAEP